MEETGGLDEVKAAEKIKFFTKFKSKYHASKIVNRSRYKGFERSQAFISEWAADARSKVSSMTQVETQRKLQY